MKKTILILALCLGLSTIANSCKDSAKQTSTTETVDEDHDHYKCPMDCEEGKTYHEEGKCPVCKMDLQKVKEE
ncbi:MAG TPA: heavy metal-binding domain-containing protein [Flavobacteriaceae bacterium]|nr:heavy metal-binding domain-containing protein [Flavobacteriaceae bacterium]